MTVKELIKRLEGLEPDMPVAIPNQNDTRSYVSPRLDVKEAERHGKHWEVFYEKDKLEEYKNILVIS